MQWSGSLDARLARYLRQQAELGGAELYLGLAGTAAVVEAAPSAQAPTAVARPMAAVVPVATASAPPVAEVVTESRRPVAPEPATGHPAESPTRKVGATPALPVEVVAAPRAQPAEKPDVAPAPPQPAPERTVRRAADGPPRRRTPALDSERRRPSPAPAIDPPLWARAAAPSASNSGSPQPETEVGSDPASGESQVGQRRSRKWMRDLPPIPGPGLSVMPPAPELLGDDRYRLDSLEEVADRIASCRACRLCDGRAHTVPGEGPASASLMCVGEGPGQKEDETGRPFVGAAGQLLDQILEAIECPRSTVYIANIVKCRPPQNRKPLPDEAAACLPFLHRQIALVRPKVLIALGGTAAEWLLGVRKSLGELRGQVHRYGGIPLVVTYHPAALLRNPNWKKPTWDDVRIARQLMGE